MKDRFLGIELGGSKGNRTSVVSVDYYAQEKKIFATNVTSEIYKDREAADASLIAFVKEFAPAGIGINAPLSLPPCISCLLPSCPSFEQCNVSAVSWMREEIQREGLKISTPYTQRPIDLLLRGRWQKEKSFIPADETLGAGRAPLAARMHYLKRHLSSNLVEVYPRLSLAGMANWYGISDRELRLCRDVEVRVENRFTLLEKLSETISS